MKYIQMVGTLLIMTVALCLQAPPLAFPSAYQHVNPDLTNAPRALEFEQVISQFTGKPEDVLAVEKYIQERKDIATSVPELLNGPSSNNESSSLLNDRGSTLLVAAASYGTVPVVTYLLDQGADPNIPGQNGVTPLMATIIGGTRAVPDEQNRVTIVKILLSRGANPNAQTLDGKTALDFAQQLPSQPKIRALLLEYGGVQGPQQGFPFDPPPALVIGFMGKKPLDTVFALQKPLEANGRLPLCAMR